MRLTVIEPPDIEPVSVAEAREHLRLVEHDDDSYVTKLISIARTMVESMTGRALITQTLEDVGDYFSGCRVIELQRSPAQSITSITYLDQNDASATISASDYTLSESAPARVVLDQGASWPSVSTLPDAVRIRYVAGYGDNADDVPIVVRHAILFLLAHWFTAREPIVTGTIVAEIPLGIKQLLGPYIVFRRS